jgi:hypothetical protein
MKKSLLFKFFFLLTFSLILFNCSSDRPKTESFKSNFKTVPLDSAKAFLRAKQTSLLRSNNRPYVTANLDLITQEKISNSEELMTVVQARTMYNYHYSRILLLNIDHEIKGIVFSMFPKNNRLEAIFSGEIIITDLEGVFLKGYRVDQNILISEFKDVESNRNRSNEICPDHGECTEGSNCVFCTQNLEEVSITISGGISPIDYLQLQLLFGTGGGNNSWDSWEDISGGGGSRCPAGYISNGNGSCVQSWEEGDIIVDGPSNPINDVADYLNCFDTNQPASITVYVAEPNPGSGDTHNGTNVGHTYISLSQGIEIRTFGFYPTSNHIYPYLNNSSSSILGDDGSEIFTASISTTITASQLQQIINASLNYTQTYHLDTYNCTDFAIDLGNLAGLTLPDANGSWFGGGGSNPGTLGQHIRGVTPTGNIVIDTTGGNAPSTNKGC